MDSQIELYQILDYVRQGYENNTVVYDDQMSHGVISKRLLHLMDEVAKKNGYGCLRQIYWPDDVKVELCLLETYCDKTSTWLYKGNPIYTTPWLNQDSQALKYYKYLNASLPFGHKSLIIAICNDGTVLLGACNKEGPPPKPNLHYYTMEAMLNIAMPKLCDAAQVFRISIDTKEVRALLNKYISERYNIVWK